MKKVIMAVALTTAMGTASAGYNSNGIFGFNPYSFMTPSWFVEEFDNFVDEFDNDNSYYRGYRYPNVISGNNFRNNPNYFNNYMSGYSRYYR